MNSVDAPEPHSATRPMTQGTVVVQRVKDMITSSELRPGDRLPIEKDLAERLGVSRGSLREGVRALCMLGILETKQGDGTYVTALEADTLFAPVEFLVELQSRDSIAHLQTVRRVLEAEAVSRAAMLIDEAALDECEAALASLEPAIFDPQSDLSSEEMLEVDIRFHRIIAEASDNPTLSALIGAISSRTARARYWRSLTVQGVNLETHKEHRAILSALRQREPDHARAFMTVHLLRVENYLVAAADQ